MSALTVDHPAPGGLEWDDLVRIWENTDAPEGCKVEMVEGIVTVTPPPETTHNLIAHELQQIFYPMPEDLALLQTQAFASPAQGTIRIPDMAVVPKAAMVEAQTYIPLAAAELLVEITSRSNASQDRLKKAEEYAKGAVPLYLLIDRWAPGGPTVTLYGEPTGGVYRVLKAVKFGESIELPEPFACTVPTDTFPEH